MEPTIGIEPMTSPQLRGALPARLQRCSTAGKLSYVGTSFLFSLPDPMTSPQLRSALPARLQPARNAAHSAAGGRCSTADKLSYVGVYEAYFRQKKAGDTVPDSTIKSSKHPDNQKFQHQRAGNCG